MNLHEAYKKRPDEILRFLNVNPEKGLTKEQMKKNKEKYGENSFKKEKGESLLKKIWAATTEPLILMLLAAAFITLGVNIARMVLGGEADFWECLGIFVAISLSVVITVIMEGKSEKSYEELNKITEDNEIKVIRDEKVQMISQKDIVAGDILFVETGVKIPADARLLSCSGLSADESSLTGESMPVKKEAEVIFDEKEIPVAERINMLYAGCFITQGHGMAVVTAVGNDSEFGKIAKELSATKNTSTPLQEKMDALGKKITVLGCSAAAVVFTIQFILCLVRGTMDLYTVSNAFITSIVLIVAAVPEGLPTIVAVSLAIDIIKMSRQNALVKKMIACETIGCINVICSDKTGTLTENKMTVKAIYDGVESTDLTKKTKKELMTNFCVNGTADIEVKKDGILFIGNPTECALLAAAEKMGVDYDQIRKEACIEHVFPFFSETKNMTTIVKEDEAYVAYTKGSPEKIISMCQIEKEMQKQIEEKMMHFQEKAYRVIAFAHKETQKEEDYDQARAQIESNMIFDGFVAIMDPLREDVYEAVKRCKNAGIELKMLTGDNLITAKTIAEELHLLDESHKAVEASEIEKMTDEQLEKELPTIRVIARSTPTIKMRVVKALKAKGNVVAVTGDGINDAPAIKNADVGIAMGISGTDVSKEASDIVLLDDSFSTIVKAVQWGRGIYQNFQRFIQFQLTVNLSSVIVVLVSILSGFATPFTALQLLWINIIMDGPPALTLGLEPIRSDLMKQEPTKRNASIVSKGMLHRISVNGVYVSILFMAQHYTNFLGGTKEQMPTILFTMFVVCHLFNAFNSRELDDTSAFANMRNNKLMLGVFAFTFALQVLITQFGGAMFMTTPLPAVMWIKILLLSSTVVILAEMIKWVKRKK